MTTVSEFIQWLSQFPSEALIKVQNTEENNLGYSSYTSRYYEDFKIEPHDPVQLWAGCFESFELSGKRQEGDIYGERPMVVTEICLGTMK